MGGSFSVLQRQLNLGVELVELNWRKHEAEVAVIYPYLVTFIPTPDSELVSLYFEGFRFLIRDIFSKYELDSSYLNKVEQRESR